MKAIVSEIKHIKSFIDLLNRYYPPVEHTNKENGQKFLLQHNFTSNFENGQWIIVCTNYWIYTNTDYQSLRDNLAIIAEEEGINVTFKFSHPITQLLSYKERNKVFLGRTYEKIIA